MISRRALVISLVATLAVGLIAFRMTVATTGGFLVWSDGLAYFFHARSLVLDGNSDITNEYEEFDRRFPAGVSNSGVMDSIRVNISRRSDGVVTSPWPLGMGLVASPFYALGYGVEKVLAHAHSRSPDSYGIVPQYFFALSSLVFGLLGFWATILSCRLVTDRNRASLAAFGVICASPAIFYIFVNPSMAHAVSFGLCAAMVSLWLQVWGKRSSALSMVWLGFLLGLLIAIRIQNAIFGLLLAALIVREIFKEGWRRPIAMGLVGLLAMGVPMSALILHSLSFGPAQATTAYLQGGIANIGGYAIHLGSPFFWDVLFSCRHGGFYWAPVWGLGSIGLIYLARQHLWALLLLATIILHTYLIGGIGIADPSGRMPTFDLSNWNEHWKGGTSFGMRYLTECTPAFAIGFAALLNCFRSQSARLVGFSAVVLLVSWNSLLVAGYGLNTISRTHCVSYTDMWSGVSKVVAKIAGRGN